MSVKEALEHCVEVSVVRCDLARGMAALQDTDVHNSPVRLQRDLRRDTAPCQAGVLPLSGGGRGA